MGKKVSFYIHMPPGDLNAHQAVNGQNYLLYSNNVSSFIH